MTTNIFPDLLSFGIIAIGAIRIATGLVFIHIGKRALYNHHQENSNVFDKLHLKPSSLFATLWGGLIFFAGILMTVGYFTQASALVLAVMVLLSILARAVKKDLIHQPMMLVVLLEVIALSLIVAGAGIPAFDLPI